jgi:ribosomal protein S18 acetylase RimI-like enzyme
MIEIERRDGCGGDACREILNELPEWFGIPASNAAYARDADELPTWLILDEGRALAILVLRHHTEAVEVALVAVRRASRNRGLGRQLLAVAEAEARKRQAAFLTVKTRGPSAPTPSPEYAETRAFYRALGFREVEEILTLWDADNPALFMAKAL